MTMFSSTLLCVTCVIIGQVVISVSGGKLTSLAENVNGEDIEEKQINAGRHKRNAECCNSKCRCNGGEPSNQARKPREIVVHHYHHHYHYCCPSNSTIRCAYDGAGSVSCTQAPPSPSAPPTPTSNANNRNQAASNSQDKDAFGFGIMFNDPIAKQFYEFISKNFDKKNHDQQASGSVCQSVSPPTGFEDPICREFFSYFSNNFVKKNNSPTPPTPTQAQTQTPTQHQKERTNFREFENINTMFDALKDELKDTFSKTAQMAKDLEGKIP